MPNRYHRVKQRREADAVVPVPTAVQDFLASSAVKRLESKTQDEYRYTLTAFGQWCASHAISHDRKANTWKAVSIREKHDPIMLHRVDAQVVHCFLEHLAATHKPAKAGANQLSASTLALYVKDIKRFLNWCVLDEQYCHHVLAVTAQRIQKPTIEETILETFTSSQIEALFQACDKEESEHLRLRDRAIVALFLDTGIRESELLRLTIEHVSLDPKDPHVRIFGKGKKWGEVGFGEQTRRFLQRYLRLFREPTIEHKIVSQLRGLPDREMHQRKKQLIAQERFFVNRAGQPLTKSGLYQIIVRLGEWADIQGVRCSPHTFRHTFSVMFIRNGGDIYQLSRLLRHSSIKVTEVYLKSLRQSEARKGAKSVLDNL
jgi:integrase/recombinase XerD